MDEGSFTFREYVLRYVNYTWNADLVEGIALAHSPDLSRAYATLSRGLNSSPESVAGWRTMSMLLRRMRRLSEAEAAAQRAIALDLADPAPRAELTRVLLEAGKISDAEVEARRAIQIFPADGRQHALLAEVLARAGKLDEALMTAEQALALRPGDQQSLQLRSRLLIRAGDFTGAEQTLGRALRLDPVSSGLRTALADVLEQQGRREEAIGVLNNLVRENTEDPHIYGRLGHYLLRETDFAGAETAFRQASAIEPSAGFRCMLSEAIERQGRRAEAIRIVQEIIAEGTQDPHVHARLGHYLLREGDAAGAEAAFREAVKIERLPGFVGMLCEAIERQGRQKEAIFILREEIAAGVRDAHLSGRLGHYLFRGGDFPAAETAFREALAIEPSSQLRGSLAEAVEQQGRSDEAIEILRAAVADSEPDAHLHARLGRLLAKAGKIDAAERAYRA